jgi:4-hydroxy-3-methylbut-2-enyl diphosphate reductase IspH
VSDNLDKFDAFVVIGGRESSNSKELYDIWVQHKKKTFYGESLHDILQYPQEKLFSCDTVAVTWWASTPAEDIKAIFDFYREHGYEPKVLSLK